MIGIMNIPIKIFYYNDYNIKTEITHIESDRKFYIAVALLVLGIIFMILSGIAIIYGINRIS